MQLLLLLALLMCGGNKGTANILEEVKPVLESIGGEELQQALKSAEQLSSVISAVQSAVPQSPPKPEGKADYFPLAPVSKIADRDITYSLSQYFAQS